MYAEKVTEHPYLGLLVAALANRTLLHVVHGPLLLRSHHVARRQLGPHPVRSLLHVVGVLVPE